MSVGNHLQNKFILKEDLSFSDARVGEDTSFVTSCLASAQNWSYTNKYCITKSTSIGLSRKFNYKNGLSLISSLSYLIYYFKSRSTLSTDALQYLVRIELLYAREIGIYINRYTQEFMSRSELLLLERSFMTLKSLSIKAYNVSTTVSHELEEFIESTINISIQQTPIIMFSASLLSLQIIHILYRRNIFVSAILDANRNGYDYHLSDTYKIPLISFEQLNKYQDLSSLNLF